MTDLPQATLRRARTGPHGTFGTIEVKGHRFHTGELPWKNNARGQSCIPAGTYRVTWRQSPKFGATYHVLDVPDRSLILFHVANFFGDEERGFKSDVDGCIGLGLAEGSLDGQEALLSSRVAISQFERLMGREDFELTIIDEYLETGEPSLPENAA